MTIQTASPSRALRLWPVPPAVLDDRCDQCQAPAPSALCDRCASRYEAGAAHQAHRKVRR